MLAQLLASSSWVLLQPYWGSAEVQKTVFGLGRFRAFTRLASRCLLNHDFRAGNNKVKPQVLIGARKQIVRAS